MRPGRDGMTKIAFVSYEIHPTTWGGAGVLLRHAAEQLLRAGHEVSFLLDVPEKYFRRFADVDRLSLPHPERCRAHHVDALCADLGLREEEVGDPFLWKALRFDHALDRMLRVDPADFVEFFEYCGVAHYALVAKLFGRRHRNAILGIRTHNSVEWIDHHEATKRIDRSRYLLYALERGALPRAEAVLVPSQAYAEAYYREHYGLDERAIVVSEPPLVPFGPRPPADVRDEVVFYGRMFEFKGVARFVNAALLLLAARPELPVRFVLIGPDGRDSLAGGSYTAYLRQSIPAAWADRFEFTGHLPHEKVRQRLARARLAVFPNRFESFCYALHEVYEAGVPVVLTDIPAFRNHFVHGRNAWFFDGTTEGLVAALSRLLDDPATCERLARPYPLDRAPLGDFYDAPRALQPLAGRAPAPLDVLVLVLTDAQTTSERLARTLAALAKAVEPGDCVLVARDADGARDGTWLELLGRARCLETPHGALVPPLEARTRDALWVLVAGDEPQPELLAGARLALGADPKLGFAGCWSRDAAGRLLAATTDIAAELHPFEHGVRPTRTVIRTPPGRLLLDFLDPRYGAYGEIAAVWAAEDRVGPGAILPEVLLTTGEGGAGPERPEQLAFLVTSLGTPRRFARLARYGVVRATERADATRDAAGERPPPAPIDVSPERVAELAWRHVNGTTLARMALRKLVAKARRAVRQGRERDGDPR